MEGGVLLGVVHKLLLLHSACFPLTEIFSFQLVSFVSYRVMYEPWALSQVEGLHRINMMGDDPTRETVDDKDLIRALVIYHIVRSPTKVRNLVFNMPASSITLCEVLTQALDKSQMIFVAECPDQSIPLILKQVPIAILIQHFTKGDSCFQYFMFQLQDTNYDFLRNFGFLLRRFYVSHLPVPRGPFFKGEAHIEAVYNWIQRDYRCKHFSASLLISKTSLRFRG